MKNILFILAFFASFSVQSQIIYQLRVDGNMFTITDVTANPDVIRVTQPIVNVQYTANSATTVQFYSMKGGFMGVGNSSYAYTTLQDQDGDIFASFADLIFWLNNNLSGSILAPNRSYNFVANANKTGAYMRGNFTVQSQGTYGSGSMNLQYSYDNTDWTTISTFTTDTVRNIEVAGYIRTTLTGATAPNLDVTIQQIK